VSLLERGKLIAELEGVLVAADRLLVSSCEIPLMIRRDPRVVVGIVEEVTSEVDELDVF